MASKSAKLRNELRALIDRLEPSIRAAFQKSIDDLQSEANLKRIVQALNNGNIQGAIDALNIDEAAFGPLRAALTQAYTQGGTLSAAAIPNVVSAGTEIVVRFNVANLRAQRQIEELAGTEITRITEDTMLAARKVIEKGYSEGQGPLNIGLDLAGRINPRTGRREGGIIGMSSPQTDAALSLRDRLLSGEPAEMQKVLEMKLRDKKFDPAIRRHIREGTKPARSEVDRMYARYVDKAIKLRGETIARTETGRAVHAAAHESFRQALDKSGRGEDAVTRVWRTARDAKVRDSHAAMDGQTVRGLRAAFVSPSGARLMHPLDTSLGADAGEIINCRCDEELNIDFSVGLSPNRHLNVR